MSVMPGLTWCTKYKKQPLLLLLYSPVLLIVKDCQKIEEMYHAYHACWPLKMIFSQTAFL